MKLFAWYRTKVIGRVVATLIASSLLLTPATLSAAATTDSPTLLGSQANENDTAANTSESWPAEAVAQFTREYGVTTEEALVSLSAQDRLAPLEAIAHELSGPWLQGSWFTHGKSPTL